MSKKILLVEDEPDLRELLKSELELASYSVVAASCGDEAYRIFLDHRFDLVISDLRMNRGGGLQLLTRLRADGHRTPFILMSGYSDFEEADAAKMGVSHLLHKPFTLDQFSRIVKEVLDHK